MQKISFRGLPPALNRLNTFSRVDDIIRVRKKRLPERLVNLVGDGPGFVELRAELEARMAKMPAVEKALHRSAYAKGPSRILGPVLFKALAWCCARRVGHPFGKTERPPKVPNILLLFPDLKHVLKSKVTIVREAYASGDEFTVDDICEKTGIARDYVISIISREKRKGRLIVINDYRYKVKP